VGVEEGQCPWEWLFHVRDLILQFGPMHHHTITMHTKAVPHDAFGFGTTTKVR